MSDIPKFIEDYYNDYIGGQNINTWWDNTVDYVIRTYFTEQDSDSDDSDSGSDYEWDEVDQHLDKETIEKIKAFHEKYVASKNIKEWYDLMTKIYEENGYELGNVIKNQLDDDDEEEEKKEDGLDSGEEKEEEEDDSDSGEEKEEEEKDDSDSEEEKEEEEEDDSDSEEEEEDDSDSEEDESSEFIPPYVPPRKDPVKLEVLTYVKGKTISDKFIFVGNIYNKTLLSTLTKLEKSQDYKDLSENDINNINEHLSYGDVSFEESWGPLDKSLYSSVKFVKGVISQIDSLDTIKKKLCVLCGGGKKLHPKTSFYFTRNEVDYDLFVRNVLLMTDILDGQTKDIITQKLIAYMKDINAHTSMIQKYIQFIIENSSIYIDNVEEFLKQEKLRLIYEGYAEYNPFSYTYVNQHNKQIHINIDPLNEYVENPTFRKRAVLDKFKKVRQNKILNELPQLKNNTIYVRDFENVKEAIEAKEGGIGRKIKTADEIDDFINNFALLYFPDMSVSSFKKSFTFSEEETDIIKKNILLDNFRAEFKDISASYADKLFSYGEENYLYTDVNTYLKRRSQVETLDLLYIFNSIDLNATRKYQIAMVSYTDPIQSRTIYKIYNPLWNNLNLLEETIHLNDTQKNSNKSNLTTHTRELLLHLVKHIKLAVDKDTIYPIPSKPNGLLYKFMLGFYINSFDKIYSGSVKKTISSGDYDIYEVDIGHKQISIIKECIISINGKEKGKGNENEQNSIKIGDVLTFVPFEALSIRSFALTIHDNYKTGMWTYGTRYAPIEKEQMIQYYDAVNSILKEINNHHNNYRKHLILFPQKFEFSRKTLKLNDVSVHRHMKLPCVLDDNDECSGITIDLDLLKKKFRFFPEFELDDEFHVGDIIYYSVKSQTKKGQVTSVLKNEYVVKKLSGRKKGTETINKEKVYGVQDGNNFQIKATYRQVGNFVDLPVIEKKIKYYLEKKTPSDIIRNILEKEYPEAEIDNVYEEFVRNYKSILKSLNTGIKVTLDFTNLINGVENINQFDIYIENVYNITHLPVIYNTIKTIIFSYFTGNYSIDQLKTIDLELPSNWNKSQKNRYTYNPRDAELVSILRDERQREISRLMEQKKYEDEEDDEDDEDDEEEEEEYDNKDDNIDEEVTIKDNYGYLLEYMKDSTGPNDILSRLREMEDKFDKVARQYTTSCGSGRYPVALSKPDLLAIKNREDDINKLNKEAIQQNQNEIHFYKDEVIVNTTVSPPQLATIKDIRHQKGEMTVENPEKKIQKLRFTNVKKQLYNEDMIYTNSNAKSKDIGGNNLDHSVLKRSIYTYNEIFNLQISLKNKKVYHLIGINADENICYLSDKKLNLNSSKPISNITELKYNTKTTIFTSEKSEINIKNDIENTISAYYKGHFVSKSKKYRAYQLFITSPFEQEATILRSTKKRDLKLINTFSYYLHDRNHIYKFDYINSLGEGMDCQLDYDGNVIGDSIGDQKCRTIVLNKNHYVCPKIIDLNTWVTLDPSDPNLKYRDGKQFVSSNENWYKDRSGFMILNKKYDPYFLNNKQKYFPILEKKDKTKKEGNNSLLFNRSKNIYPGLTQNNLPCCFKKPNTLQNTEKITSNYVSKWGHTLNYQYLGLLPREASSFFIDCDLSSTGKLTPGFFRFGIDIDNSYSFLSCFFEAVSSKNDTINSTQFGKEQLYNLINHPRFNKQLFNILNKGTLSYNFKLNTHIDPFQSYCRYLLSHVEKEHTYLYNLCVLPVLKNLDEFKKSKSAHSKMLEKLSMNSFYQDVFNMEIKMKTKNLGSKTKSSNNSMKPILDNRNIFIFDYITKNKPVYKILKSYFESNNVNVSKEYIESLISNNNINTIRRTLKKQYGPLQLRGDLVSHNTYEVKLLCPTFCHSQSIEEMKKNKNIFILKNKNKYELIIYNYGNSRKTIQKYLPSYVAISKKANDIKNPYQDKFAHLKHVLDNIYKQLEGSCLYTNDKGRQYDNMTHLQLGLIEKRMPVCMNFEQTMGFLPLFKIIIDMTRSKSKSEKLTTHDIENFETDVFEKDSNFENILKKTIFLYDNYNHIIGCLMEGFIIPILPSSYDYNDIILKKINLISYYEIKPNIHELENAKNTILFLENVYLVLKLYNKGSKFNIIRKLCTPIAYKPKVCITPNADNKIESIITYTNQVIKCSTTTIKDDDFENLYSNYEFMRASFFEIERGLNENSKSKSKSGQTKESQTLEDDLVKSVELFEQNHHSLPKLEYYYNHNKGTEELHSITIKYKNHLDEDITLHLFLNRKIPLTRFTKPFLSKIKSHIREEEIVGLKRESHGKSGFEFNEMYELLIYLWNRSNRRLSLKPVNYFMTDGDVNGDIDGHKKVSGFYLENNMNILFKNKAVLTEITKQQINLKRTFNPFESIQLNEMNKQEKILSSTIQKLHNNKILYELFIRELSRALQLIDRHGYTKTPKSIPYEIGNVVWIEDNGWKLGKITKQNLKNYELYEIEYQNKNGTPISKEVHTDDIYVSYKIAIFNILNKQVVNIFAKVKALNTLFNITSCSASSIFKKYFSISDIPTKRLDTYRYKKSRGKLTNVNHYNHAMCSRHADRTSCAENPFCKWSNEGNKSISLYDKFKSISLEEYECKLKLFILRAYYSHVEYNEKNLPIRFVEDFYGYNQEFALDILNKYDKKSPEFTKNVLLGYDVIRKELGLKPIFSLKNLIKPEYRKSTKKEAYDGANEKSKTMFETNVSANKIYKVFVKHILNTYSKNKIVKDKKDETTDQKITHLYGKGNSFMMRVQEEIQKVLSEFEKNYVIQLGLGLDLELSITQAIKYMWDNKKDEGFMNAVQNHNLISVSQNMGKSTCKLHIHTDEFNYFMKKAIEQMIRNPKRRLQILTNTFKTYNPDEPYIKKEHEFIFTNEDINKLLQSDVSKYELSQFVNEVRFFDITYSNQSYSKQLDKHISSYNGLDFYNKNINTKDISKNVTFKIIRTTNKNKSFLNRGGNKMTNRQLSDLKRKIDMINKKENIKFLESYIQKDVKYEIM